ncbi:VanZ family protein [Streptococcus dentiloxodontae]
MRKIVTELGLSLVSFLMSYYVYMAYLQKYVRYIARYGFKFELMLNTVIIIFMAYFIYNIFKAVLTRHINRRTLILIYCIYFSGLFYVLFLKNIGVQGFSLNPLSFANEIYWGSRFVPVMNFLMFIPTGLLFRSSIENILLSLIALFFIESAQYFFHLGIFDLGDIVLNIGGILLGTAIAQIPLIQKLKKTMIK